MLLFSAFLPDLSLKSGFVLVPEQEEVYEPGDNAIYDQQYNTCRRCPVIGVRTKESLVLKILHQRKIPSECIKETEYARNIDHTETVYDRNDSNEEHHRAHTGYRDTEECLDPVRSVYLSRFKDLDRNTGDSGNSINNGNTELEENSYHNDQKLNRREDLHVFRHDSESVHHGGHQEHSCTNLDQSNHFPNGPGYELREKEGSLKDYPSLHLDPSVSQHNSQPERQDPLRNCLAYPKQESITECITERNRTENLCKILIPGLAYQRQKLRMGITCMFKITERVVDRTSQRPEMKNQKYKQKRDNEDIPPL